MSDNTFNFVILPPLDPWAEDWAKRLADAAPGWSVTVATDEDAAARLLPTADGAYGWVPPHQLALASRLRWLQNPFAGPFVGYYYQELIDHPVTICNPRGIYSDHIAHHIMMFMLALSRGLPYYHASQQLAEWNPRARQHGYVNLRTATVLIVGVGGIGAETARLAHAFGAKVLGIEPRPEHVCPAEIHDSDALDDLLDQADFVVTTVPHTPETEGMWNQDRFDRMKRSAYFINIGRGMTTSTHDLTAALQAGTIAGAGLDVFEVEPLPADHPLWTMDNVLITPHVAVADADDITDRRFDLLVANARALADGAPLTNVVDKSKWY